MNSELAAAARSSADQLAMQGPQYAVLCSLLRQCADALDQTVASTCAAPAVPLRFDADGVPLVGNPCVNCE